jgi:hypothetical protein
MVWRAKRIERSRCLGFARGRWKWVIWNFLGSKRHPCCSPQRRQVGPFSSSSVQVCSVSFAIARSVTSSIHPTVIRLLRSPGVADFSSSTRSTLNIVEQQKREWGALRYPYLYVLAVLEALQEAD